MRDAKQDADPRHCIRPVRQPVRRSLPWVLGVKVAIAFCAAWLLRCVYAFDLADRIEDWAGIDYTARDGVGDADEYKVGGSE